MVRIVSKPVLKPGDRVTYMGDEEAYGVQAGDFKNPGTVLKAWFPVGPNAEQLVDVKFKEVTFNGARAKLFAFIEEDDRNVELPHPSTIVGTWRNLKKQTLYRVVGYGKHSESLEWEMELMPLGLVGDDNKWHRPLGLFLQKFERVTD